MSRAEAYKKRRKGLTNTGAVGDVVTHAHSFPMGSSADTPIISHVHRASADNRRDYVDEMPVPLGSPVKRHHAGQSITIPPAPTPAPDNSSDNTQEYETGTYEMGFEADDDKGLGFAPRAPRIVKPSDPSLHRFRALRDQYLANLFRREGCQTTRTNGDVCRDCRNAHASAIFRCRNCFGDALLCRDCMVARHADNPLHRIEMWNDNFFESTSLKTLGMRIQLGTHPLGQACPMPHPLHKNFVVLHTNGIHEVDVDACNCEHRLEAGRPEEQLLRAGWFPATDDKPRTCATLEVLDQFLISTHQAKTTMYDFYTMLERLTNNTGIKPRNRYHAWLRMVREYSHLLLLKRGGRGHDPTGVAGTKQGELAVLCPCCSDPDVNLPADWKDAPPDRRFLYILFLALDACFRLKRRLVSSLLKDPPLGSGWAYMVECFQYRDYLLTVTDQKEMSTCSGLAALDYANTKFSTGYAATGVGMGVCARHKFVQPNGVGDLQKGERYANMDWIFACIMRHKHAALLKILSYDILQFSLNLVPGSAQTDGEGIERPWAHIGGVASSTREMGPGSRDDTLDSHWSFWNWTKLIGLGERNRTKLDQAKTEYASQLEAFTEFSLQQAEHVLEWRLMVQAYEMENSQPNPYESTMKPLSEAKILLEFEQEESKRVEAAVPGIHSVSPSSFIAAGLEVEDQQRRVRVQVELKKAQTTAQKIDVVTLRRRLSASIKRLRTLQATYTPASIVALAARKDVPEDEPPEQVPLFLPSALTAEDRAVEPVRGLALIEDSLREAQCSTAMMLLRNQLHVKSRFLIYKQIQARNQGPNTRSRTLVARNEMKIRLHSEKYQMAWEAKRLLAGGDATKVGWRMLRKEDIRCMEDAEEVARNANKREKQLERRKRREDALRAEGELPPLMAEERAQRARGGENMRAVSWIWTAAGTTGTDGELEEALRIEWAKAWARTRRWGEQLALVQDEASRFPVSMEARAQKWEERVRNVPLGTIPVQQAEGLIAYGLKQAAMYRDIAKRAKESMTEVRRGRGKRRMRVVDEDEVALAGVPSGTMSDDDEDHEEGRTGWSEDDEELNDLRGDVSDEEFILGGGDDD
ncbi:hypothetical protein GGX14DRAFT_565567 [Mycena pura]|uniref:CxC2-like cysteine cluster KDZ transposase-associated domain-containing protein n=1 Tax=Mycena pura TaxID=153505 RepID=A0AAD6VG06_9AGAR|nr:hypothetical protein GGX14DRAFT_565567 [Mycena pura]